MGVEAAKAIRARPREVAARVDRLIANRDEGSPIGTARRERIKAAVRDGASTCGARDTAQAAVVGAQVRAGGALARIVAEGLSLNDAAEALGLSTSVGRRLVQATEEATRLEPDSHPQIRWAGVLHVRRSR